MLYRFYVTVLIALLVTWFAFVWPPSSAYGATVRLETIDEALSKSELAATVIIERAVPKYSQNTECGIEYVGRVTRVFSGKRSHGISVDKFLRFGRASGLEHGQEYLLFLKQGGGVDAQYRDLQIKLSKQMPDIRTAAEKLTKAQLRGILNCDGLAANTQFDSDAAWPIKKGEVEVFGLWPLGSVPNSIHIEAHRGPIWHLNANDVFQYMRSSSRH